MLLVCCAISGFLRPLSFQGCLQCCCFGFVVRLHSSHFDVSSWINENERKNIEIEERFWNTEFSIHVKYTTLLKVKLTPRSFSQRVFSEVDIFLLTCGDLLANYLRLFSESLHSKLMWKQTHIWHISHALWHSYVSFYINIKIYDIFFHIPFCILRPPSLVSRTLHGGGQRISRCYLNHGEAATKFDAMNTYQVHS